MDSRWCSSTFLMFLKFFEIKEGGPNSLGGTNYAERLNYLVPPSCISILEVWRTQILHHSLDFNVFYMIQQYFPQVFEIFFKLKRGDLISWGEPILQNGWIIWSPILYFNFRSLNDPNSLSFIRFWFVLCDWAVLFSGFWNFLQIKVGGPNFLGEPILQNSWIFWSPLLYFNFRSLKDSNSLSFIRFQCVLHDKVVLFSGF